MTEDVTGPLTSLRRSPLVELAVRQLHEQLLAGRWQVGARLPAEPELAEQLGVGRSTLREAVRALVHAGLLETRQGSGTYVRSLAADSGWEPLLRRAAVLEVYEVREALEVQAARLAALRRTDSDVAALRARLAARDHARDDARDHARDDARDHARGHGPGGTRGPGSDSRFVDADLAFHAAVIAAAHNALLTDMFNSFASVLREALAAVVSDRHLDNLELAPTHDRLVTAIERGDPDAAEQAAREHIGATADVLRSRAGR
ncbi:MAG: FadR family transcriptional regulator [Actinobacteria bacterium]|nr:FadR family transcriptional regulator [Actinomycetota bacterium]